MTETGKKTLNGILSFIGGFGLGALGSIVCGRDYMDMINDLNYFKGLGYMFPALGGTIFTASKEGGPLDYLINIGAAETGYVLGSKIGF